MQYLNYTHTFYKHVAAFNLFAVQIPRKYIRLLSTKLRRKNNNESNDEDDTE